MVVRMRLARLGRTHMPFYRIVVADSRRARDGKHLEVLGTYDPNPNKLNEKHVRMNLERCKYWLSVGAQPSDTVARLLGNAALMPTIPRRTPQPKVEQPAEEEK
eukprot:TRINITY_DN27254_c0_g1_i1.p2 TRINITY_DN27254_c0_g1~~TRINITY_DN27254_c0_g1_i1.p2  ORF type:complete len:104 (-),score=14.30 TRINITY_DN27254_c0_g1_i1:199-510(-)